VRLIRPKATVQQSKHYNWSQVSRFDGNESGGQAFVSVTNANAEYIGTNLLPCNAAGRLQARHQEAELLAEKTGRIYGKDN